MLPLNNTLSAWTFQFAATMTQWLIVIALPEGAQLPQPGNATLDPGDLHREALDASTTNHGIFARGQAEKPYQPALSALGATPTGSASATPRIYGMARPPRPPAESTRTSPYAPERPYASTGNELGDAQTGRTTTSTGARDANPHLTALKIALEHRKSNPLTPYRIDTWSHLLNQSGLIIKYPHIPSSLRFGFDLHVPAISKTQAPPNKPTIFEHISIFRDLIDAEVDKGRYIGPFSESELTSSIGPFQTSPFSILEKPSSPGKYRLLQNYSFPHTPITLFPNPSINSQIGPDDFPATWGTFCTIAGIIAFLPPGSQAASRDVSEAYRTVPVHHSQWPGMVARGEGDKFYVDTASCFGLGPSAGVYCILNDAAKDLFRFKGMGPLSSWVDDHVFFRFPRTYLQMYNAYRRSRFEWTASHPSVTAGSRRVFYGNTLRDGHTEEFDEDFSFPLLDLSPSSPRPTSESDFTYSMEDIDKLSAELGIPWQVSKDQPFSSSVRYLGFLWDLPTRSVSLLPEKAEKYTSTIHKWLAGSTFNLQQTASIHGKLVHASLAIPEGRPYLRELDTMLSICSDRPFMLHSPPRRLRHDLEWWLGALSAPLLPSPITLHIPIGTTNAFSDASSSHGIGIVINGYWRAWALAPQWTTLGGSRDIAWAEAAGFELLVRAIIFLFPHYGRIELFGDNVGVIDAWKKCKSRNREVNQVFKRISRAINVAPGLMSVSATYVPSELNPADGPSRFIFPPAKFQLPRFPIPDELIPLITDVSDSPLFPSSAST